MKKYIINYIKSFWKVYLFFFCIFSVFIFNILFYDEARGVSKFLLDYIFRPAKFLMGYIPAIVCLYLIFKKLKSKIFRLLSISLILPVTNLIYVLINIEYGGLLYISSLYSIFCGFFITLFIPKKCLSYKKWVLISETLLFIIFLCMGILILMISSYTYKKSTMKELEKFNSVILYLEDYKLKNGKYPEKIKNEKIYSNDFPNIEYEIFENGKDYKLKVYEYEFHKYIYCSDKKYTGCHEGSDDGAYYSEFGNWIEMKID